MPGLNSGKWCLEAKQWRLGTISPLRWRHFVFDKQSRVLFVKWNDERRWYCLLTHLTSLCFRKSLQSRLLLDQCWVEQTALCHAAWCLISYQLSGVVREIFRIWCFLWTCLADFNLNFFHPNAILLIFVKTKFIIDLIRHYFMLAMVSLHHHHQSLKSDLCPCFCGAQTACVSYSLNVIDKFPLWRQPSPTVADM